jgi:hypothetical protein
MYKLTPSDVSKLKIQANSLVYALNRKKEDDLEKALRKIVNIHDKVEKRVDSINAKYKDPFDLESELGNVNASYKKSPPKNLTRRSPPPLPPKPSKKGGKRKTKKARRTKKCKKHFYFF